MGYSLCMAAIFGHFENTLFLSNISGFFELFFAYNNFNVFVETFLPCFREFNFLT